jgi:glutathione S-transferase
MHTQLYIKMTDLDFDIEDSEYPYSPLTGSLPTLIDGDQAVRDRDIVEYLVANHTDIDSALTAYDKAGLQAFYSLIEERMAPAMRYLMWIVNENYSSVTKQLYRGNVGFPLKLYLPYARHKEVAREMTVRGIRSVDDALGTLRECYKALSDKLALEVYFSSSMSSLDIIVAANIAVHYLAPLKVCPMRQVIAEEFPNLERHFQRVLSRIIDFEPTCSMEASAEERRRILEDSKKNSGHSYSFVPRRKRRQQQQQQQQNDAKSQDGHESKEASDAHDTDDTPAVPVNPEQRAARRMDYAFLGASAAAFSVVYMITKSRPDN